MPLEPSTPPQAIGPQTSAPPPKLRAVQRAARDAATRAYLAQLLSDHHGDVALVAKIAGVERESLYRLLRRHRLRAEDYR